MPAYHSNFNGKEGVKSIASIAMLPINAKNSKGPAPRPDPADGEDDIVDEALKYFKANVFFKNFEVKGDADRLLIFLTLYISQALTRIQRCNSKDGCLKEMYQLSIEAFPLPGDPGFPLSAMYSKPASKNDSDMLRSYLLQLRQELGIRLVDLVIDKASGKPSKWWLCFTKRKFMGKSFDGPGR